VEHGLGDLAITLLLIGNEHLTILPEKASFRMLRYALGTMQRRRFLKASAIFAASGKAFQPVSAETPCNPACPAKDGDVDAQCQVRHLP